MTDRHQPLTARPVPKPTTPATQLEIAAQWLQEAALGSADESLKINLRRVAHQCIDVAGRA